MDPVDKVLAAEDRLVPSSGFQARVMDAVRAEQGKQPPTPFPWARFAVGVVSGLAWAAAGAALTETVDWSWFAPLSVLVSNPHVGYATLVTLASLAVVAIPRFRSIE